MQLWKACIPPCLLRGLDCTGIPATEARQLATLLVQQARAIAKSYSMFTRESNAHFMARLKVAHPADTVGKALTDRTLMDAWLTFNLARRSSSGDIC